MPSIFTRARLAIARAVAPRRETRAFNAAQMGRMYADWFAAATSSDAEIRGSIRRLIDRSRDLERNNDYQRGYLRDCEDNIVGAIRRDLRMDCGATITPKKEAPKWQPDTAANLIIENAWEEWGKKGTATICGQHSWRSLKLLGVRSVPRDGNLILRKIKGPAARNRFNFALQLWEVDHLDLQKFGVTTAGHDIRFGIEYDHDRRVAAYWLRATHPGDLCVGQDTMARSIRFPAEEIVHVFVAERAEQSIGIPWCVSAITRLRQLGAFEEAATIAARIGASSSIFFKTVNANGGPGPWEGEADAQGRGVMDVTPGMSQALPENWDIADWTPPYPNIQTGDFRKAMLRGVATSFGTSYTTMGNDLESVNYSSARVGLLDERETWKMHQDFFAENMWEPIFADWLETAILAGAIALPIAKFASYNRPRFKSRRWAWVDPVKEVEAAKTGIALRLTSRRQVIDEAGGDVEDVMHDNKADEELAEDIGLSLTPEDPQPESFSDPTKAKAPAGEGDEDEAPPKPKG